MKSVTKERAAALLDAALGVAMAQGWRGLTHEAVAQAENVSASLVKVRLGTAGAMRTRVMRLAVERRCIRVVAEGLVCRNRYARKADESLREACAMWVWRA